MSEIAFSFVPELLTRNSYPMNTRFDEDDEIINDAVLGEKLAFKLLLEELALEAESYKTK